MPNQDKPEAARLGWRLVETAYPFADKWLQLRRDRILDERDGDKPEIQFAYVDHQAAVSVVPVTKDGMVAMVWQYRYPADEWMLEVPAGGTHDTADTPYEEVARKELREELGATCEEVQHIGFFYTSPGNSSETLHVYLALGVEIREDRKPEHTEFIEPRMMPLLEVLRMARACEMRSGVTALSILLCENALRERGLLPV